VGSLGASLTVFDRALPKLLIGSDGFGRDPADDRKRALYQEVFDLLRPGGTFLNCEHVASRGPWGQKINDDAVSEHLWRRRERGEAVSLEEVRTEYVSRRDRADNNLALVEDQCGWLREIGFQDVDCS
jgi:tRNA (cmo5U34)-methyltransferase